ncbi:hypothetical protein [Desulfobaculum bizertense]|uniref:Uncharacterized protein n=1 Tax=Desulfobaculum bizertense DSM 18034 TaxID=1121442 RepID=A0A1T4VW26_9BACT|nr:hypothetical protein [Desulfobaculum bizertense]UIJ36774.1 hypothetical protein LWC08_08475 [Desulfobaculum bizertense]SKA69220.1 hypothetical protein SAMN02745702_01073 [Desulfobaculum bizertense DSM 18034]
MSFLKLFIKTLGFVLAVPFITYGFLGLIRFLRLEGLIDSYLGFVGSYKNPVTAFILVVIGLCLMYGLNALANKMR